jgi:hypothetical protein
MPGTARQGGRGRRFSAKNRVFERNTAVSIRKERCSTTFFSSLLGASRQFAKGGTMNELLRNLSGGNLISDGKADQVADKVVKDPRLTKLLMDGLFEPSDLIRGRTAHAVERVSRTHPERVVRMLPRFVHLALHDDVPMVKWHMAMIFGNLDYPQGKAGFAVTTLLKMLNDDSVFVKSWALTSLAVLGRKHKETRSRIVRGVRRYSGDESISVRTKACKVIRILRDEDEPIPSGWIKAG